MYSRISGNICSCSGPLAAWTGFVGRYANRYHMTELTK